MTVATGRRPIAKEAPVRFYPVDDYQQQIDRVELLLGDYAAVVGGMNSAPPATSTTTSPGCSENRPNFDRLDAIFEQDWSLPGGSPRSQAPFGGPVEQTTPGDGIRPLLASAIAAARVRFEAEVFDLTDPRCDAARSRSEPIDPGAAAARPNQDVNHPSYLQLRRTGVQVRWFRPRPGGKLHAKAVLARDLLVLGPRTGASTGSPSTTSRMRAPTIDWQ